MPPDAEMPPVATLPAVATLPPESTVLPGGPAPPVDVPAGVSELHPQQNAAPAKAVTSTGTRATDMWERRPECLFTIGSNCI